MIGDAELVFRIERDAKGRGYADTFETYESKEGKAVLVLREEDIDGNGEVDVASFYHDGKLVRREIIEPDLVPM